MGTQKALTLCQTLGMLWAGEVVRFSKEERQPVSGVALEVKET